MQGDSGGPLVYTAGDGVTAGQNYDLVLSRLIFCSRLSLCSAGGSGELGDRLCGRSASRGLCQGDRSAGLDQGGDEPERRDLPETVNTNDIHHILYLMVLNFNC